MMSKECITALSANEKSMGVKVCESTMSWMMDQFNNHCCLHMHTTKYKTQVLLDAHLNPTSLQCYVIR